MLVKSCLLLIAASLIVCSYFGVPILIPLTGGLLLLTVLASKAGYSSKVIGRMLVSRLDLPLKAGVIFMMIGIITAMWRASGTIPMIIYFGARYIEPKFFLLACFWICAMVSFLLGSAFGSVGTIGLTLIVMARAGGVDPLMAAGAIISGCFVGDQCSPMSSTTNMVAVMTRTSLHKNVLRLLKALVLPFTITSAVFAVLSLNQPLQLVESPLIDELAQCFVFNGWILLPAVIVLFLMLMKVGAKAAIFTSALAAAVIAWKYQGQAPLALIRQAFMGYEFTVNSPLRAILPGGGVISIINSEIILIISTMYGGIFSGTDMLSDLESSIIRLASRIGRSAAVTLAALATCAFAASQVFAVMLTEQIAGKLYDEEDVLEREALALALASTAMLISSLVPWNICSSFPAATLGVGSGYIPFNIYAFMIPACFAVRGYLRERKQRLALYHFRPPEEKGGEENGNAERI
jgi:NhaC family Na+:H+ antiporter